MGIQKTDAEWNQIRFQNSLGPQIGGLIHDAVALTIAYKKEVGTNPADIKAFIGLWVGELYKVAENQKKQLTGVKPLDIDKAVEQGDKWKKDNIEEANRNIQETVEEGREREAQDKLIQP